MPKAAAGKDFPILPEGNYDAVLAVILETPHVLVPNAVDKQGQAVYKDRLTFVYVVDAEQPEGEPFEAVQFFWNSDPTSKNSRIAPVVNRLLQGTGRKVERGMEYNDLIGTQVKITTEHSVSERNGKTYSNIVLLQRNPNGKVQIPNGFAAAKLKSATKNQATTGQATQQAVADAELAF